MPWSRSNVSETEAAELLAECNARGLSKSTCQLLTEAATRSCCARLVVALKLALEQSASSSVEDTRRDGLTPAERQALGEVDGSGMPTRLRETAHGILCVYERWVLLKSVSKMFREAKAASAENPRSEFISTMLKGEDE